MSPRLRRSAARHRQSSLDDCSAWRLAARGFAVAKSEGVCLLWEGQTADRLYLIIEGEVELRRGEQPIHRLGPGDFVGVQSLLSERPSTASVYALGPLRLIAIPREAVDWFIRQGTPVAEQLLSDLTRRAARGLVGR